MSEKQMVIHIFVLDGLLRFMLLFFMNRFLNFCLLCS